MSAYDIIMQAKVTHTLSRGDVVTFTISGFPNHEEAAGFKQWLFQVIARAQDDAVTDFRPIVRAH